MLEEMDGEEGAGRVITALQELSSLMCAQGRKVGTIYHSKPGSVSALLVENQNYQPLNLRGGIRSCMWLLQKLQSGMHCSTGNTWVPKDHPTPSSCIG